MSGERWRKVFTHEYDPLQAGSIDGTDEDPHDQGIVRALNASYKPNNSVAGDSSTTLFVGRLNFDTSEEKLKDIFSSKGAIKRVRIVRDIVTGFSKGYAFVEFEDSLCARRAWSQLHRETIDGNVILVEYECERSMKNWVPRRLGGGIGGRKESGQLRFGGRDKPFHEPIFLPNNSQSRLESMKKQGGYYDSRERREERDSGRSRDESYRERQRDRGRYAASSKPNKHRHRDRSRERRSRERSRSRERRHWNRHRSRSREKSRRSSSKDRSKRSRS